VSADNPQAAARIGAAIHDALEQLAAMAEMGHTRVDLTERPLKFWRVFSYLIVYDPASAPLTVIAILHGSRDLEHLLRNV
jgi:plasmid stabilization system protein ParE